MYLHKTKDANTEKQFNAQQYVYLAINRRVISSIYVESHQVIKTLQKQNAFKKFTELKRDF
jgi:hypothetical protein